MCMIICNNYMRARDSYELMTDNAEVNNSFTCNTPLNLSVGSVSSFSLIAVYFFIKCHGK